jgi:23S rRNA pseudouridine955/2504/2580 synthase
LTRWSLLGPTAEAPYREAAIETGRTHQIRRHLASLAHPVAGDKKYGDFGFNREAKARWGLKRLFLHAERIEFPHPEDGRKMTLRAPLADDLVAVLQRAGISGVTKGEERA